MYSLRNCLTCEKARGILRQEGMDFDERLVEENPKWLEEALRLSDTVPVFLYGDRVEIGFRGEEG